MNQRGLWSRQQHWYFLLRPCGGVSRMEHENVVFFTGTNEHSGWARAHSGTSIKRVEVAITSEQCRTLRIVVGLLLGSSLTADGLLDQMLPCPLTRVTWLFLSTEFGGKFWKHEKCKLAVCACVCVCVCMCMCMCVCAPQCESVSKG